MLQFRASLTDDPSIVNYDRKTFMVQATENCPRVEQLKGASLG